MEATTSPPQKKSMLSTPGLGPKRAPQFLPWEEERESMTLTVGEIVEIESDLHGLTEGFNDLDISKKELMSAALSDLNLELSKIPDTERSVFLTAQKKCPELVDDAHKSAFLSAERYDAKLAAQRLVSYWEHKQTIFGEDKCFLPITLQGALRDDMVALSQGLMRLLPVKDEFGRAVVLLCGSRHEPSQYTITSMIRACWYILEVAGEDPDVHDRGIVLLTSGKDFGSSFHKFDFHLYQKIMELEICHLPVRFRCCHHCFPTIFFHLLNPLVKFFLGRRLRFRYKVHYGSDDQVFQELATYGLPKDRIPTELGGVLEVDHGKWLCDRLKQEIRDMRLLILEGSVHDLQSRADNFASKADQVAFSVPITESLIYSVTSADNGSVLASKHVDDQEIGHLPSPLATSCDDNLEDEISVFAARRHAKSMKENKKKTSGRGDPRMNRAVATKLSDPDMTLFDALRAGGFLFPNRDQRGLCDKKILDSENISLYQRKNQLNRRLRKMRKKEPMIKVSSTIDSNTEGKEPTNAIAKSLHAVESSGCKRTENDKSRRQDAHGQCLLPTAAVERNVANVEDDPKHRLKLILASQQEKIFSGGMNSTGKYAVGVGAGHEGMARKKRDSFCDLIAQLPGLADLDTDQTV